MEKEKKSILIVDDEPDLRDALADMLDAEGYGVLVAKDGKEGLDTALAQKPDLILLDVMMPNMDGFGVLDELRKDEWGKSVKVIFLTVLNDAQSISRAMEGEGYTYLVKTEWDLAEIVKAVEERLGS